MIINYEFCSYYTLTKDESMKDLKIKIMNKNGLCFTWPKFLNAHYNCRVMSRSKCLQ